MQLFAGLRRLFAPRASGDRAFNGLTDPALLEYIRTGGSPSRKALETSAVFRCVSLIANSIGMLPLHLKRRRAGGVIEDATDHPLYPLLLSAPNSFQTAFVFRSLMERRVFTDGNAYAQIVRGAAGVLALVPLCPTRVEVEQKDDWSLSYRVTRANGAVTDLPASDVLHLFSDSEDGITGISRLKMASAAIGLAEDADQSLSRIYGRGLSAGGALTHPGRLSPSARDHLKASMAAYSGSENAGKWMVLDEGMTAKPFGFSAHDSETAATRKHQIEDIARFFGIPRPLLGMDDTSWGSGIEQLAILFVRFALNPSFTMWEQAIARSLLTPAEKRAGYYADFDERSLLRGSMKDQADYFAKALGHGGGQPWLTPNEVRKDAGESPHPDGDRLASPLQPGAQNVASPPA